ncbi:MAG TPA: hypothetical protein VLM37_00045 [Fibrobacteraceae bacterium]|nr:hypothetical protein [Fibrobacteraceae bacterium]
MINLRQIIGVAALVLLSCGGTYQYEVVKERQGDYEQAYRAYQDAENEYINLLFNMERVPNDAYLLELKKTQMKELMNLRSVMLQSRSEFDEAVQQWENDLLSERGVSAQTKPAKQIRKTTSKPKSQRALTRSESAPSSNSSIVASSSSISISSTLPMSSFAVDSFSSTGSLATVQNQESSALLLSSSGAPPMSAKSDGNP